MLSPYLLSNSSLELKCISLVAERMLVALRPIKISNLFIAKKRMMQTQMAVQIVPMTLLSCATSESILMPKALPNLS